MLNDEQIRSSFFIHHSEFIVPVSVVKQLVADQFHRSETRRLVSFDRRLKKDQMEVI